MLAAILFAGLGLSNDATANTVVRFAGVIDSLSAGYEIPGIEVGDAVSGTLTFNPSTLDGSPVSWIGYYPDAIVSFDVAIGSRLFTLSALGSPASEIDVINDEDIYGTYYDQMLFRVAVEEAANPGVVRFLQLTFSTGATSPPPLLLDDTLPDSPDLNAFDVRRGFITYIPPGGSQGSNFALTAIEVIPIREPRDLTGDGKADIVVRNMDTGYVFMWEMDGNLKTYYGISSLPLNREIVGIADLTGDGKADIVLRNSDTGYLYMWEMDGNLKTYHGISSLPLNRDIVGIADLTGDGKADIVVRNSDTGYLYMWEMDGNLKIYYGISPLPLDQKVVGIGDLNGDGMSDILLRDMDSGFMYLWEMEGDLKADYDIGSLPLNRELVQIADLTGDGKADILLRNMDTGYVYMWEMDGNLKTYYGISKLDLNKEIQPPATP